MKSDVVNTDDEIDVLEMPGCPYARIRIRESQGRLKCSVFLGPEQLDEHAAACSYMARQIRERLGVM